MGKKPKVPKQQVVDNSPWTAVQPYLKDVFAKGQTAQTKASTAVFNDGKALSAGLNATQKDAQSGALNAANQLQAFTPEMMGSLRTNLNANDITNNPALQNAITAAQTPVVNNFTRKVLPQISLNSLDNSGLGSSRQGIAEGLAMSDLNQTLSDQAASMTNEAYKTGLTASNQALALTPETFSAFLTPQNIQQTVGAQQQAITQQQMTDAFTKWNFDNNKDMNSLQQYAQLLQGNFGGSSSAPAPQAQQKGGGVGGAIGGALSGYAATGGNPIGAVVGGLGGLF